MRRLDESQEVRIPPNPELDERAAAQDFYRGVVRKYRERQRRRQLFREILWTLYFAVIGSAALIYVLRAVGLL